MSSPKKELRAFLLMFYDKIEVTPVISDSVDFIPDSLTSTMSQHAQIGLKRIIKSFGTNDPCVQFSFFVRYFSQHSSFRFCSEY